MDLYVYDVIGAEGCNAESVRADLEGADPGEPVTVRINSPGGDVFQAFAMASLLERHDGPVDGTIDGVAASAASFLAATLPWVTIAARGQYMIHNPWSLTVGDAGEHRGEAALLDQVAESLAVAYASRSRLSVSDVAEAMEETVWLTGREAAAVGLVDGTY